jgi:hypothetical protein
MEVAPASTLPHELLKHLPADPAALLAKGNQLVLQAFQKLEAENAALRNTFARSQRTIQVRRLAYSLPCRF